MTRGIIIGVFPNRMLVSREFNGDMMPKSKGIWLLDLMDKCQTEEEFVHAIHRFDYRFFGYGVETGEPILQSYGTCDLNLKENTFGFEDYLYITNLSGEVITVTDREGEKNLIINGEMAIYNYNKYDRRRSKAKGRKTNRRDIQLGRITKLT